MDQYRRMFDQAVEQLGPGQDKVEALRGTLARRCLEGQTKEVIPMKKHTGLLRGAVIAAVVVLMLSVTAAAVAIGQRQQIAKISSSDEIGVFELDGRYYFKPTEDGELIDITGQFSDTTPYVYDPQLPPDEVGNLTEYVIGGSGDHIGCVLALYHEGEETFSSIMMVSLTGTSQGTGSPLWWRAYCEEHAGSDGSQNFLDGFDHPGTLPSKTDCFQLSLDGLTVDEQTGAVILTVNGETQDITAELDGGTPYVLTVEGREHALIAWGDESLLPDADDPDNKAATKAYYASFVYGPNTHDILVYRDGDQVRYAEFIYRQEGTLRYWTAWNCPTAAQLSWLEEYTARHGFELDWLVGHAYEDMADDPFRYGNSFPTWDTVERARQELEEQP
ncbi:MAG: hypothetical protein HDT35_08150 [Clostridiales bacterium]|nr:hypothetical protein [Clostridiales bacterium]